MATRPMLGGGQGAANNSASGFRVPRAENQRNYNVFDDGNSAQYSTGLNAKAKDYEAPFKYADQLYGGDTGNTTQSTTVYTDQLNAQSQNRNTQLLGKRPIDQATRSSPPKNTTNKFSKKASVRPGEDET